jgi:hypothetical protein
MHGPSLFALAGTQRFQRTDFAQIAADCIGKQQIAFGREGQIAAHDLVFDQLGPAYRVTFEAEGLGRSGSTLMADNGFPVVVGCFHETCHDCIPVWKLNAAGVALRQP